MPDLDDAQVALLRVLADLEEVIVSLNLHDSFSDMIAGLFDVSDSRRDVLAVASRLRALQKQLADKFLEAQSIRHALTLIQRRLHGEAV